jgi:hypothetical protein
MKALDVVVGGGLAAVVGGRAVVACGSNASAPAAMAADAGSGADDGAGSDATRAEGEACSMGQVACHDCDGGLLCATGRCPDFRCGILDVMRAAADGATDDSAVDAAVNEVDAGAPADAGTGICPLASPKNGDPCVVDASCFFGPATCDCAMSVWKCNCCQNTPCPLTTPTPGSACSYDVVGGLRCNYGLVSSPSTCICSGPTNGTWGCN